MRNKITLFRCSLPLNIIEMIVPYQLAQERRNKRGGDGRKSVGNTTQRDVQ